MAGQLIRGEIIGADFSGEERIVIHVAAPIDTEVGHAFVTIIETKDLDRMLPTADDVRGILGDASHSGS